MPTRALERRLVGVQMRIDPADGYRFVVIAPESWPAAVQAAYDSAKAEGDHDLQADIVEAQMGIRPSVPRPGAPLRRRTPPIVEIRTRPDGPQ